MCGIVAIFSYSRSAPPVERAELLRIREAMVRRGPDGAGLWLSKDQRIGLAHRRLAIIDLSDAGTQPMATTDGSARIVFNGEIYNYRELRRDLEVKGYKFFSQSDTEVLLHLYQEHDRDMVYHLRGMYSFALWDERRQGLFLARDPFGIKPLYYSDDGMTIRVASQVKALLQSTKVETGPEPAGHVGFYLWGHVPEPYTLFRGIRALPAGTTLWIDATSHKAVHQYFSIAKEFSKVTETQAHVSHKDIHEHLRPALLDTVRCHLVADVPVGLFLSAGIDSGTLTGLAREVSNGDLRTITLGFKEFQGTIKDEVPLAEQVAKQYGTHHHTAWVTKQDFLKHCDAICKAMDQPSIDGINSYFVSKVASESGLKVVISGLGGDELLGSYPSFQQIPRLVTAALPFHAVPFLGKAFRYVSVPILKHCTSPKYSGLLEYGSTYGGAYLLRRGMFMPWELPDLLDHDMVREGWNELRTLSRLKETTIGIRNSRLKVCALESTWYMRNQLLRDADWASMAHSLEVRVPLVDINLYRALTSLLSSSRQIGKRDMGLTVRPSLPHEIIERDKTGFSIPVRDWVMHSTNTTSRERGLRRWAQLLYAHETGDKYSTYVTCQ